MDTEENQKEIDAYWQSKSVDPYGAPEVEPERTPTTIYSLGFDAEELLATYAALRAYMKALAQQENEQLPMIERIVSLMLQIRPSAIEASKSLSLKAAEMEGENAGN
jgi:hypothetical protein